ncbi:phosphatidylglycerophosphatase B [Jinshanibacter sp. LJY008]|uniref:undecaprenyl-diphosphate phosphatase n=1 Tax=Limnobaculum eriocheiris TaxID=2897391 RepID=A0A9X1SL66_9GAMM|nr:phosphatidylglycerophosphatase B [Limnobaculum eriocheiris]MCD1126756.1 phosphatidylglycerophosphatase B [Limnobaculum eriocheiris]
MLNGLAKRISVGVLLLLVMPVFVWFIDWTWTPDEDNPILKPLFWMTETASSPWGAITSAVLALWFVWRLRLAFKPGVLLIAILAVTIVGGQGIKSAIKETIEESRPFVLWMENEYQIDDNAFYALPRKERARIVEQHLKGEERVPPWLSKHWERETGYSFPSGHTLFTATWALLGIGMLWPRRRYVSAVVLMAWAVTVAGSRLLLGMHWPEDLMVSVLLSGLLAFLACKIARFWVFSPKPAIVIVGKKCEE